MPVPFFAPVPNRVFRPSLHDSSVHDSSSVDDSIHRLRPSSHRAADLAALVGSLALFLLLVLPNEVAASSDDPSVETGARSESLEDSDTSPRAAHTSGFIHGRVETRYETYEGRLRWNEEAFWDQYFDSNIERRAYGRWVPVEHRTRKSRIRLFGSESTRTRVRSLRRGFMARFADIAMIEPHSRNWSTVTMRDGSRFELEGGNDMGWQITVQEPGAAEMKLSWQRIRRIVFLPTPPGLEVAEHRLYGTAISKHGTFTGTVQWDKDECTSLDELDGTDRQGQRRTIPMGEILSLENLGNTTRVVTHSGEEMELGGTNDVNRGHRGLWVDDARYGRVLIPWESFESLELLADSESGPGYEDFITGYALAGSVTTRAGKDLRGELVFDLDESRSWEVLNGHLMAATADAPEPASDRADADAVDGTGAAGDSDSGIRVDDSGVQVNIEISSDDEHGQGGSGASSDWHRGRPALEYDIPFEKVASLETVRRTDDGGEEANRAVRVRLWNDETLELMGTQDVNARNAGLLVFRAGASDPTYVPWDEVSRIDFDPPPSAEAEGGE